MTQKEQKEKTPKPPLKKSYIPPVLSAYGSIAKLSQGAGSTFSDHGNNMMRS